MEASRFGRGKPINRQAWPASGVWQKWLAYCDKVHRDNGLRSVRYLAKEIGLSANSGTRVGQMLRGVALPDTEAQARDLLEALGAVGAEVDRGVRLYRAARAEQDQGERDTKRPGWWLRSGYVEQIADLAPLQLLDRRAELDELAAWCTGGDESYVWWRAGPRAGKSALMAWFVLHPPPGVWIISFFVTARLVGQDTSAAFTTVLLDQLAAITGDRVPQLGSAPERDRA